MRSRKDCELRNSDSIARELPRVRALVVERLAFSVLEQRLCDSSVFEPRKIGISVNVVFAGAGN